MLKYIGIIVMLSVSSFAQSHEYQVVILDKITGETQVENCLNESELISLKEYVSNINDGSLGLSVKKIIAPNNTFMAKVGGGEGGGD